MLVTTYENPDYWTSVIFGELFDDIGTSLRGGSFHIGGYDDMGKTVGNSITPKCTFLNKTNKILVTWATTYTWENDQEIWTQTIDMSGSGNLTTDGIGKMIDYSGEYWYDNNFALITLSTGEAISFYTSSAT